MAPAVMPLDNIPEESLDSQDSSHSDTASSPLPSGASDVHHAGETELASVGEDEPNLFQEEAPAGGGAGCVQEGEERYVERGVDEKEERVSAVQGDGSEVNVQNGALTGDPGLEVGQGNGGEREGWRVVEDVWYMRTSRSNGSCYYYNATRDFWSVECVRVNVKTCLCE